MISTGLSSLGRPCYCSDISWAMLIIGKLSSVNCYCIKTDNEFQRLFIFLSNKDLMTLLNKSWIDRLTIAEFKTQVLRVFLRNNIDHIVLKQNHKKERLYSEWYCIKNNTNKENQNTVKSDILFLIICWNRYFIGEFLLSKLNVHK